MSDKATPIREYELFQILEAIGFAPDCADYPGIDLLLANDPDETTPTAEKGQQTRSLLQ